MSGRMLALVVGALVAAAAAYFVAQSRAPDTQVVSESALFPALADGINDIDTVTISGAGGVTKVTLNRGEAAWTIAQRDGYRADPSKVRKLLIDLADAQLVERKTARPENYPVLGVEDIASESATGVQIALGGLGPDMAVILGNSARSNAAKYVRRASEASSWVADTRLRVDQDPADWLNKELIDINAARVQQITITHADGEVVAANRGPANFEVVNLPEGQSLSSPTAANAMAEVFDDLKLEDVTAAATLDTGDAPQTAAEFRTSDGLKVAATAVAANGKYYLQLTTTPELLDVAAFSSDEADPAAPSPADKARSMFEAMQAQSAEINARVAGWAYTIPLFKYELLTRRMTDLVAAEATVPAE